MERILTDRLRCMLREQNFQPVLRGQMVSAAAHIPAGRRVAMILHDPARRVEAHTRDYVELLYQCAGKGVYQANDRTLELNAGELLLLGQNTLLTLPEQEQDALAVRFLIKPDLFGGLLIHLGREESPLREFLLRCMGQETPYGYLHFRVGGMPEVENLVENLLLLLVGVAEAALANTDKDINLYGCDSLHHRADNSITRCNTTQSNGTAQLHTKSPCPFSLQHLLE